MTKETFNKVTDCLDTVFWTLNSLQDYWDDDTQDLFHKFLDESGEGAWTLPSLEEVQGQIGAFWAFIRENVKGA